MTRKKTFLSVLAICMLMISCLFTASCSNNSKISGTYYFKNCYVDGKLISREDNYVEDGVVANDIIVNIYKDNTFSLSVSYDGKTVEQKSIWVRQGEYIYSAFIGNESVSFSFSDGNIILWSYNQTIIFTKKKPKK